MAALADDPAIGPVLRSPLLSAERRRQLAQTLARDLSLSDLLTRFVAVLADHQRLNQLPAMAEYFQLLLDQELGRVRITMRSARPLDTPAARTDRRRLRPVDRKAGATDGGGGSRVARRGRGRSRQQGLRRQRAHAIGTPCQRARRHGRPLGGCTRNGDSPSRNQ